MHVGILHISDLHRDPRKELSNDALLDSLETDQLRYLQDNQEIPRPSIIVVSGDIIYGVKHDHHDAKTEIERQYEQAYDFLVRLCDSMLDGNRNRVVLIPGNHDVNFPITIESLDELKVDPKDEAARELVKQLWTSESSIRWNWNTLSFWKISRQDRYAERLDAFRLFYDRFYDGLGRKRYSLLPQEQYDIFDYPTENITIVAMSSCYHNDPLHRQGSIHPNCISDASRAIRSPRYSGRLLLATWHHNTSGGPMSGDYMDAEILQVLIDRGFSIGLHGHQHKPQFIDERFAIGGRRKITVLSASTLCAGPSELPSGQRRGYNILAIDTATNKASLHQRSMLNDDFSLPVWGQATFALSGTSSIDFEVQPPLIPSGGAANPGLALATAEEELRAKRFEQAATILRPLINTPLARPLLLEALTQLDSHDSHQEIVRMFMPPTNIAEIINVAMSAWEISDRDTLRQILALPIVNQSVDPAVIDLQNRFKQRL